MAMEQNTPYEWLSEIRFGEWVVVQVLGDLDANRSAELSSYLEPSLTAGANLAIDLRRFGVDPERVPEMLKALATTAGTNQAHLVVVESDPATMTLLVDAGVPDVFESLDAALHVTAPPLRDASSSRQPPLAPASGDATLMTVMDMLKADDRE
jgi:anti-anti-sigma regulatory factor